MIMDEATPPSGKGRISKSGDGRCVEGGPEEEEQDIEFGTIAEPKKSSKSMGSLGKELRGGAGWGKLGPENMLWVGQTALRLSPFRSFS